MAGDASFELFTGLTCLGAGDTASVGSTNSVNAPLVAAISVAATGVIGRTGVGNVVLPALSVTSGGQNAVVELPALAISAEGLSGSVGKGDLGVVSLGSLQYSGTGISGRVGIGDVVLVGLTVRAGSHENTSEISPVTVSAVGHIGQIGEAYVDFGAVDVSGVGTAQILGSGSIKLYSIFSTGSGIAESEGAGSVNLRRIIVNANGIVGRVGSASISIPALEISAEGNTRPVGVAGVELYPIIVNAYGETELVDPVFKTVVLNTRISAVSEYNNFGYNSICEFGGMVLVASKDGIFALKGSTDNGTAIVSKIKSGITDLNTTEYKSISQAYLHGTMDSGLILSVTTEDGEERKYRATQENETVKVLRILTGRGVYSRNWQWGLEGRFKIDDFAIEVEMLRRRIR